MLEEIKKNWFILVVAAILVIASGFYIVDQSKDNISAKKKDGKQLVFSVADKDYFAEDFQKDLDENLGDSTLYHLFRKELLSSLDSSDEMKKEAKERSETFINYIQASQGRKGLDQTEKELKAMGFKSIDNLKDHFENELKYQELLREHYTANFDSLFKEEVETNKPRLVKHILVKIEDAENITDAEKEKIKKVEEALAKGEQDFEEIALAYSDDTETGQLGGSLGVVDAKTNFVESFVEAMLKLEKGEKSDWVDSSYGKHIIYIEETDFFELIKDAAYLASLEEKKPQASVDTIIEAMDKAEIEFANDEVKDRIYAIMGIKEDE